MKLAMVFLTNGKVSGGAAKQIRQLTPLLLADERIAELRIFLPQGAIDSRPGDWPIREWPAAGGRARRDFLRKELAAFGPDVLFIPSARWLPSDCGKTVVMVRNMEPLETPFAGNRFIDKLKNIGRRLAAHHACKRADRIIAVSGHVRDYLTSRWSLPPEKIAVVYHGVEEPPEPRKPASLGDLADAPFIFTAGSIRPARGLPDLVAALADERVDPALQLVIGGSADTGVNIYRDKVVALARRLGVDHRIHWAGQLNPAEMSWCFRNSVLFVTTSRAEACPNTVLEAMRHGTLSVSGDNAPMPEFFGPAALYYRIGDSHALAGAIAAALALPPHEQERLRALARARSEHYSWQRTADDTISEMLKVAAS